MALVDIITLIESESREQSDSILSSAQKEADLIIESASCKAKQEAASLEKEAENSRVTLQKRKDLEYARSERIAISSAQQEVVDSVFCSLQDELQKLSGDDLREVFVSLLQKIDSQKGEVVVYGNKKSELETAVKTAQKEFIVSESPEINDGGFLYKGDGFEMDFSFSALVEKELRPKKEGEIFKALF